MMDSAKTHARNSEKTAEGTLRQTFLQLSQSAAEASDGDMVVVASAMADLLSVAEIYRENSDTSARADEIVEFCRGRALPTLTEFGPCNAHTGILEEVNSRWIDDLSLLAPEERTMRTSNPEDAVAGNNDWNDGYRGEAGVDDSLAEDSCSGVELYEDGSAAGSVGEVDRAGQFNIAEILAVLNTAKCASEEQESVELESGNFDLGSREDDGKLLSVQPIFPCHALPAPPVEPETIDDPELVAAYADDAQQCVGEMEASLLRLESGQNSDEALRGFCRQLHTLKGASGTVGLSLLAKYLHEVENYIEGTSGSDLDVDSLLECVDAVQAQLKTLGFFGSGSAQIASPVSDPVTSRRAANDGSSHSGAIGVGDQECFVRVEASRLDRLMDLLAELVMLRNRRDTYVESLRTIRHELNQCAARTQTLTSMAELQTQLTGDPSAVVDFKRPSATLRLLTRTLDEVSRDTAELGRSLQEIHDPLADDNSTVSHLIGRFRQELMELRRVPVGGLFQRLQRAIRAAAKAEGKLVEVRFDGQGARADRAVQERLFEPLLHLVRNAVSHGVDTQNARIQSGKPPAGRISLAAWSDAASLCIEVRDDGRGLDNEALEARGRELGLLPRGESVPQSQLWNLIFHPGFSTKTTVSEISGRGVGMDVVNSWVKRLRGRIDVESKSGQGTTFRLQIPLRSSVEHAMVVRSGDQLYALPMHTVSGTSDSRLPMSTSSRTESSSRVIQLSRILGCQGSQSTRGCHISLLDTVHPRRSPGGTENDDVTIVVDAIVGVEEVVVRPLPSLLHRHDLFAGVTLAGRAETVLLLDIHRIMVLSRTLEPDGNHTLGQTAVSDPPKSTDNEHRILVVDDSVVVRRSLSKRLRVLGLEVREAANGREALNSLNSGTFAAIVTDLDMPVMGGIELMEEINRHRQLCEIPVIVLTSRDNELMPQKIRQLQPRAILNKPITDRTIQAIIDSLRLVGTASHH